MKVIVTGGTGLVGHAIKKLLPKAEYPNRQELRSLTHHIFALDSLKDKNIIHLAAKVGGVKSNMENQANFYLQNSLINERLLHAAYLGQANKVVSLLSTCVYPSRRYVIYPLTEDQLHNGPPHESNYGYAYSKRMLEVMSRAYRQQYGCNFITAIPNNLYGEGDNFDLEDGHVIPSLIRKVWEAKLNKKPLVCWGDGLARREFTYSGDVAEILRFLLEKYDEPSPINIGNTEEYNIREVIEMICEIMNFTGQVIWDSERPVGQFRKPSSNQKLLNLGWDKDNYTSLRNGLTKTCEWFINNYPNLRGY